MDEPAFAIADLVMACEGDLVVARSIAAGFVGSAAGLRHGLAGAAALEQWDEVRRLAHQIKGMAATIGARRLSAAAAAIEDGLRLRGETPDASALGRLHAEWEAVDAALRRC